MSSRRDSYWAAKDKQAIRDAVSEFGDELRPRMSGDGREEDKLRQPVYSLLKKVGEVFGRHVFVHDEVTLSQEGCRPDFAVDTAGGRTGYIELKALDKGVPGHPSWRPTAHDKRQWERFAALPNLIYTNGQYWSLIRDGQVVGRVAEIAGDLRHDGARLALPDELFQQTLRDFLSWRPVTPRTLRQVVVEVAPLCRLLRDQVAETIAHERHTPGKRPLTRLAQEWRSLLFPMLDDDAFADSYAQTVTFALLLARVDGCEFEDRSIAQIAGRLAERHSLMGGALAIVADPRWVKHLTVTEMLRRVIGNIDWNVIGPTDGDASAMLYETFLSEYDPELRRRSGTYYTPDVIARTMVRFTDQILKVRHRKARGLADDQVMVVDPAMGTGTFLVEVIESVVATTRREWRSLAAVPQARLRELLAERLVGFELQVAPYAVAEMRIHHLLKQQYGVELPAEEVRFLSDALEDPDSLPLDLGQLYESWADQREGANRFKRDVPVMLVIGNPPWRERAAGAAPWIEAPRDHRRPVDAQQRPSMDEFKSARQSRRTFNLSNMWTYFWRWAVWKAFEANPEDPAGIVALITPKAYLASASHEAMRSYMRQTADEGWIIDLSPEDFRPDVPSRPFPTVQQPICIGIFARYGEPRPDVPATIHYTALDGTRAEKFRALTALRLDSEGWVDAESQDLRASFLPAQTRWSSFPALSDLLVWSQAGVNANRNWVWAPHPAILAERWRLLVHAAGDRKASYFKETRDRSLTWVAPYDPDAPREWSRPLADETSTTPRTVPVAYRSFDRQHLVYDGRVIDGVRAELWRGHRDAQLYLTEQHAHPIRQGPAVTFTDLVPNVHHFDGRGGRVFPLRRSDGTSNVNPDVLRLLSTAHGQPVAAEDVLAYVAAIAAHPRYVERFGQELRQPGVRIPLTASVEVWDAAVRTGREVLWIHTFGERFADESAGRPHRKVLLPEEDRPVYEQAVPGGADRVPDEASYETASRSLLLNGAHERVLGVIANVMPEVWEYRVGGQQVLRGWFERRVRQSRRKQTSELDRVNSVGWVSAYDDELLTLLNVLGRCVRLAPVQARLLDQVLAGPLIPLSTLIGSELGPAADIDHYDRSA